MAKRVVKTEIPDFNQPLSAKLLGEFIRARRTHMGVDIQSAAMLCGVSPVTLQKVENASPGVRLETVLKVASAIGVRVKVEPWREAE